MEELQYDNAVRLDAGAAKDLACQSQNNTIQDANGMDLSCEIRAVWPDDETISFQCRWRINAASSHSEKTFQSVDILINARIEASEIPIHPSDAIPVLYLVQRGSGERRLIEKVETGAAYDFLVDSLRMSFDGKKPGRSAVKLVLPNTSGYVARCDFLDRRMVDCVLSEKVVGFLSPRQRVERPDFTIGHAYNVVELLAVSAGGILLKGAPESLVQTHLELLEEEVDARISLPWLLPSPIERRRVVFVDHEDVDLGGGQPLVWAVLGLDLTLIVVACAGHSFRRSENSHIDEVFLPVDLTADEGLPARIADVVRSYTHTVDGIFTFNELMHVPTAKAAELLSVPTSPVSAYIICTDKYATRTFVDKEDPSFQAMRFFGRDELRARVQSDDISLRYPLIVKPTKGCGSEGVYKVNNVTELYEAADRIAAGPTNKLGQTLVVETFIDGPEFDANIVLCDSEVLFFELADDFPSAGDSDTASVSAGFLETSVFTPSNLPKAEAELVRTSLHRILLNLGFRWGVFHIEGRVRNSTMHYIMEDGILDLRQRAVKSPNKPSCFLIEINARAASLLASWMVAHTYGIDYVGLHVLCALRDTDRLKALCRPFKFPGGKQSWSELVLIAPERGGVCTSDDACAELEQRCPDLKAHIAKSLSLYKRGDSVPDPATGELNFIAFFVVYSRVSRLQARQMAEKARRTSLRNCLMPSRKPKLSLITIANEFSICCMLNHCCW